jgi:hypothetical protein
MRSKLKSLKILQVLPNGCVHFDHLVYLKTYTRYNFSKKSLFFSLLDKKKLFFENSNFFYKKYRNQSVNNLINEFKTDYRKY